MNNQKTEKIDPAFLLKQARVESRTTAHDQAMGLVGQAVIALARAGKYGTIKEVVTAFDEGVKLAQPKIEADLLANKMKLIEEFAIPEDAKH